MLDAACILLAVGLRSPVQVISCVADGVGAMCDCAECIPGLDDFLNQENICSADPAPSPAPSGAGSAAASASSGSGSGSGLGSLLSPFHSGASSGRGLMAGGLAGFGMRGGRLLDIFFLVLPTGAAVLGALLVIL